MTDGAPLARMQAAGRRFGSHVALHQVDLSVTTGERVALLGASGAGKSTLLALLNGSIRSSDGRVEVFGQDLASASASALRRVQRRVGTVSQRLDLIDQVRVLHNVNAGRLGRWSTAHALVALAWPSADQTARDALDRVGLGWAVHERTDRLSGGEQQRVAIARLLVQQPDLVLADEPVASLDPVRAAEVLELLSTAAAGGALVVSLHQPDLALRWCSRVVGLHLGQVAFDVPVAELDQHLLGQLYRAA